VKNIKDACEDCPCLLKKTRLIDIARKQQIKKQEIFRAYNNLWFVGLAIGIRKFLSRAHS
jgi:hypothetical protein